ncbi:MAG: hypothetical protein JXD22_04870 [Sedimentisphaerales bacterium]|nr:hypothetical protein [Sedimentisphaerales bacterium]
MHNALSKKHKLFSCVFSIFLLLLAYSCTIAVAQAKDSDSTEVRKLFAAPPTEYSSGPLWVWNDLLTEEQIVSTLNDLAGQKVKQVFVHPRPGLMTPYLSQDWFRLWKAALTEAEKLDMNVWIYDENSYPSGFAGGLVPEAMPESRGLGIVLLDHNTPPTYSDELLAAYQLVNDNYVDITEKIRNRQTMPEGKYLSVVTRQAPTGGWFGGKYYVDLLRPGVTEKFLEITMGAYQREIGDHFGKRVPGVFTDEPHLCPAEGLHWTPDLAQQFQQRWGYNLMDHLPSLFRPVGDWKHHRHNYYQVLLELFIERWSKPCYEYCQQHNLEFTGHYWEHGWPGASHGGDNMAMYAWHQRPAIDTLMNQYSEGTGAQFGNIRAVKELSSVANQLGKKRTLCEAYGAGGWDLRFEDMKGIGDWLYVLGVNTLDEHLSYITIRGARKRDHPQSFSYHEPWWPAYHIMAEYFSRLSVALSHGREVNEILIIEPTTAAWMYQGENQHLNEIGSGFQQLVTSLSKAQVEYDIGCEDIISRHGQVENARLLIGQRQYHTVVISPLTENLNSKTMELLEKFLQNKGTVLCCGQPPERVNGKLSEHGLRLSQSKNWVRTDTSKLIPTLLSSADNGLKIKRTKDDQGILLHQRRRFDDGELLFLVNTSITSPTSGTIETTGKSIRQWNPETGNISPYHFNKHNQGTETKFNLEPCASLLLFLSNQPGRASAPPIEKTVAIEPTGPLTAQRLAPNVLTIDYVDVSAGGKTLKNVYFYKANQFVFQQNGMDRNPWDSCVQLHDTIITRKFPPGSGFEATYNFRLEETIPNPLFIVIERPDLYTITCNQKTVSADNDTWWLDKAFGKINITDSAKIGDNSVTIKASPMTIYHELEPAYLLGDFSLKSQPSGFTVIPDQPLIMTQSPIHSSTPDGTMWLSTGVGFHSATPGDQPDDSAPWIIFDLGQPYDLDHIIIWNYNERNLTNRGVKELEITAASSNQPDSIDIPLGTFTLKKAPGTSSSPNTDADSPNKLLIDKKTVQFVKFKILSNHNDTTYPANKTDTDNAFVGLSEVRFFAGNQTENPEQILNVNITTASSQLTHRFDRQAKYLIDNSGFGGLGWNNQGSPFYSGQVSYSQQFLIHEVKGRYLIHIPDWYGSVAEVKVNRQSAGYVGYKPFQRDVTDLIRTGTNIVEIIVTGTLKNTLGPHHAGSGTGSAWPGMFQNAPQNGPPPGNMYHTIDYGLFEPFVLSQINKK